MTYRTLADGTRVYPNGYRYTPVAPEDRKYEVRKPPSETAVRWHGVWLEPLDLLPEEARSWPVTEGLDPTRVKRRRRREARASKG